MKKSQSTKPSYNVTFADELQDDKPLLTITKDGASMTLTAMEVVMLRCFIIVFENKYNT